MRSAKWMVLVALLFAPATAWADRSPYPCFIYFRGDANVPKPAAEIFDQHPVAGVTLCQRSGAPADFGDEASVVWPEKPGDLGVCLIELQAVYNTNAANGSRRWMFAPSPDARPSVKTFAAALPETGCNARQFHSYPRMSADITEGTFLSIARFWERVRAGDIELRDRMLPRASYPNIDDLVRRKGAFRLSNVTTHRSRVGSPHYYVEVAEPFSATGWMIYLDIVEGEVRILDISKIFD